MHAQRLSDGRYAGRYRTPDGRPHRTLAFPTAAEALRATAAEQKEQPYTFSEGKGDDRYYVGRYKTPDGWQETEDGFYSADDALAEARELERAARAGTQQGG